MVVVVHRVFNGYYLIRRPWFRLRQGTGLDLESVREKEHERDEEVAPVLGPGRAFCVATRTGDCVRLLPPRYLCLLTRYPRVHLTHGGPVHI